MKQFTLVYSGDHSIAANDTHRYHPAWRILSMLLMISLVTMFSFPVYSTPSPVEHDPVPMPRTERWWDNDDYNVEDYLENFEAEAEGARIAVFNDPELPDNWDTDLESGATAQRAFFGATVIAKFVGSAVLKGVITKGTGFGFDTILSALFGFGDEDQYGQTLSEIQASLDQLETQMNAVLNGIKAVMDQATRITFEERQQLVAAEASTIRYHFQQINDWIDQNYQPSQSTVENVALSTELALARLQGLLNDSTGGTVPALLDAANVKHGAVSNLDLYWSEVQYYFDTYKATVAQGLIVLDVLVAWDTTGDVGMSFTTSSAFALQTIEGMFNLSGVPYFQIDGEPKYLHARYEPYMFTSTVRPTVPGENLAEVVTGYDALIELFNPIRNAYDPSIHGMTLEDYMRANGQRVEFNVLDNNYIAEWYVQVSAFNFVLHYQFRHQRLEFRDNDYSLVWLHSPERSSIGEAIFDRNMVFTFFSMNPEAWKIAVETNIAGNAASFDQNWIHSAVIGVDGFEVAGNQADAVTFTIANPFAVYPQLRFIDHVTGEVFASFDAGLGIQSFNIPANGDPQRLIRVEQGHEVDGYFLPRAESAFVTDSGSDTWITRGFYPEAPVADSIQPTLEQGAGEAYLLSGNGYTLLWQYDGNLVLYGPSGVPWASNTQGLGNHLSFQGDGNLVIYDINVGPVWASNTPDNQHGGKGGRQLSLLTNGNVVITNEDGIVIWQTGTGT